MADHPIQGLMKTVMESIKDMVDVNTVVGEPVETSDGNVIIPVSRVSFGFASGGGEYHAGGKGANTGGDTLPFGGGSGAGVSINPVGFLVVGNGQVRLLPVDGHVFYDRLIDLAPQVLEYVSCLCSGEKQVNSQANATQCIENKKNDSNGREKSDYNPRGRK